MPGRTDGPGADEPGRPGDGGRPRGSQDELSRRLANLPSSHPSSPDYRGGRRPAPPAESRPERDQGRSQDMNGETAAAAARAARGQARVPAKDRRAADDALWARAASWHAAAEARRQAPGTGVPSVPSASREPFRPWFTASAGEELWLNAEGTGEPWFASGGEGERGEGER